MDVLFHSTLRSLEHYVHIARKVVIELVDIMFLGFLRRVVNIASQTSDFCDMIEKSESFLFGRCISVGRRRSRILTIESGLNISRKDCKHMFVNMFLSCSSMGRSPYRCNYYRC